MSNDPTSPALRRASRDRIIEQALKHELASGRAPGAEHCLDAETLAAWMDGGLDTASIAAAEAHVSNCARCRALTATMAKTLPAEIAGAAPGFRAWRSWLVPLAAGAAAVTLWMVVPQRPQEPATPTIMASREAAPPPAAAAVEAPQQPASPVESRRNQPAAESPQRLDDAAKATDAVAAAPAARNQQAKAEAGQRADTAAPQMRAEANLARESKVAQAAAAAEFGAAAPAPPAAPALEKRMRQGAPIEVVSPDPSRRWRTAAAGAIDRSDDGGRSWTPARLPGAEEITAGASPSPGVCWFVGARGLVLLAVDGATFVRLPFPETVDLAGVTAVDARAATVTAADGRTFQTSDSGRTWR